MTTSDLLLEFDPRHRSEPRSKSHRSAASWVLLVMATLMILACRSTEPRCALCGMKIDPSSVWRADLVLADGSTRHYDSPRCALTAWRSASVQATSVRVVEYYDRQWVDGADVFFVVGSDVSGPMGADLVPVGRSRAQKFAEDHLAGRPLPLAAVTQAIITDMR